MKKEFLYLCLGAMLFSTACKPTSSTPTLMSAEDNKKLQEQFITAKDGTTIEIPIGIYELDASLTMDAVSNVIIKGQGTDKTILSFKNQKTGAEGIHVVGKNITIQDLTVQDTKGDAIKVQNTNGITMKNLKITWTAGSNEKNGGYGLYPVTCENVNIEKCDVSGASDAGIYVGQSKNIIVKDNYAHENVAGIEIENSDNAEVFNNKCFNNTGGILVFDLPELPKKNGSGTKIHDNTILENNHVNFAPEGNIVGITPAGSGIILLAAKKTEIYNNTITRNRSIGIAIASYPITGKPYKDSLYIPLTSEINIHSNTFERTAKDEVDTTRDLGKMLYDVLESKLYDIVYDGITVDNNKTNSMGICIGKNTTNSDIRFANIDAANKFQNVKKDIAPYQCK